MGAQCGCVLKALLFSWQREDGTKKEIILVPTEPQFHKQDRLGSCFGCRIEKIQRLPWQQLVPAWHYSAVRENSLTRNPGATLAVTLTPPELGWKPLCTYTQAEQVSSPALSQVSHSRVSDLWILKAIFSWHCSRETAQVGVLEREHKHRNCWAFIHSQLKSGIFLLSPWLLLCLWASSHLDIPQVPHALYYQRGWWFTASCLRLWSSTSSCTKLPTLDVLLNSLEHGHLGHLRGSGATLGTPTSSVPITAAQMSLKPRRGPLLSLLRTSTGSLSSLTSELFMHAEALLTLLKAVGLLLSLEITPFLLLQGRQNALTP